MKTGEVIDWKYFPKLELLEIGGGKIVEFEDEDGEIKNMRIYSLEIIPEFEEYLAKKRQEQQEDEAYCSDEENEQNSNSERYNNEGENQAWLDKWLELRATKNKKYLNNLENIKNDLKSLDLSWQKLKGKFVIKDYPKLKSLNLGHNLLNEIVIENCPRIRDTYCLS